MTDVRQKHRRWSPLRLGPPMRELEGLSDEKARELWHRATRAPWRDWRFYVAVGLSAALPIVMVIASREFFFGSRYNSFRLSANALTIISVFISQPLAIVVGMFAANRIAIRRLWVLLPQFCDACGYDLTGNASGVCPECDRAVERAADDPVE